MPDQPDPRHGPQYIRGEEWQRRRAKRHRRVRLALLIALPLLAVAGVTALLLPRRLLASGLKRFVAAQPRASTVHVVSYRLGPNGRRTPAAEEWVAGNRWLIQRRTTGMVYHYEPGRMAVLHEGKTLRWNQPLSPRYTSPQPIARQVNDLLPSLSPTSQLARVESLGHEAMAGKECAKLLVHMSSYRHLLWIDPQTDRLVCLRSLRKDHRGWTPTLEHRFDYHTPYRPPAPRTGGMGPAEAEALRKHMLGKTIRTWIIPGRTVRLHSVETNEQGDLFLLLSGARRPFQPQITDDLGIVYSPTFRTVAPVGGHRWTLRHYTPLVRSPQTGRRTLTIASPDGADFPQPALRIAAPAPDCVLVPSHAASAYGWEDLDWLFQAFRARTRAERLWMASPEQSPDDLRLMITRLPGSEIQFADVRRSQIAVEEYEKLLALQDDQALTGGSAWLLYRSWVDLYRHLKVLGRHEEAVRALRLAREAFMRPGRAPDPIPNYEFEEVLREEGIPLPPPSEA